ncbi:MAG: helix-turn-helix transcriptional regulator [Planctomycetes bacterium]|nr:helix-turn-helix transcriptional regulator [Planctomycetota bacterium]
MPVQHQIIHFAEQQDCPELQQAASINVHIHSALGWYWHKGMQLAKAQATDHLRLFPLNGSLSATINTDNYNVSAGSALWIHQGSQRSLRAEKNTEFIALHIDVRFTTPAALNIFQPKLTAQIFSKQCCNLIQEFHEQESELHRLTRSILLTWILQHIRERNIALSETNVIDQRIQHALQLWENDPSLNVEAVAAAVQLGTTQFRSIFFHHMGIKPAQYLKGLRVQKAAELLHDPHLAISEIALRCGYENPNYLFRVFKQHYHCTPAAYRRGEHQLI